MRMKLMTREIEGSLPPLRATDALPMGDRLCIVKYFTPDGCGTWWAIEGEKQEDGDWLLFGLCDLGMGSPEFGYISLNELKGVRGKMGLPIERDLYTRGPLREVVPEDVRRLSVLLQDTVPVPEEVRQEIDAERRFSHRANFNPGDRVVNVLTGESWRVPR